MQKKWHKARKHLSLGYIFFGLFSIRKKFFAYCLFTLYRRVKLLVSFVERRLYSTFVLFRFIIEKKQNAEKTAKVQ